jgi:hypothetical protein
MLPFDCTNLLVNCTKTLLEMRKRAYHAPSLVVYGTVEDLTQTGCIFNKEYNHAEDTQYGHFGRFFEHIGVGDCEAGYS